MFPSLDALPRWLFGPATEQSPGRLAPRWLFLRALGLICFSAFFSLVFQVRGLVGPDGLLSAGPYLEAVRRFAGAARFWYAPTVFWFNSGSHALVLVAWVGMIASLLLVVDIWPRAMIAVCLVAYLSFISVLQAFSSYQSDGMLLSAGFISLFFAPPGLRPGWGERHPPSRASLFLLQFVWFTIYFESGVAKILGGDPEWRHLSAMNDYYQDGPLPTWIAWYAQHLPGWFHVGSAALTLGLELGLVWALFLPRRFRIVLFWIVTPWQVGIILTSNYAFLNYLVLALGILLLDDRYLVRFLPLRLRERFRKDAAKAPAETPAEVSEKDSQPQPAAATEAAPAADHGTWPLVLRGLAGVRLWFAAFFLTWVFYAIAAQMVWMVWPRLPLPSGPIAVLEPLRIANQYGLFAVMTRGRYEIEFQGSTDGQNWMPYPFRYKPQDPGRAPGIFAPYQPRFEWNLWFASLDNWQQNHFVVYAEERLLTNSPSVLSLFAGNPFAGAPPLQIRAVVWEYWFTGWAEKRQGLWWRREYLGLYAPELQRQPDGSFVILALPQAGQASRN